MAAAKTQGGVPEYGWHIHHEQLFEPLTEPIENRIRYVESSKPSHEQAVRLKLMRKVKDNARLHAAVTAREEGWPAYREAVERVMRATSATPEHATALRDANSALERAQEADFEIYRLHREECEPDCPWNGTTIFSRRAEMATR